MRPGFIFRRESAVQQRRLFAGPFAPAKTFRKVRIPALPDPGGIVFQAVHTADVARAYHLAVKTPVHGAFNLAADPSIDMRTMGSVLGVPVVRVPAKAARSALAAAWSAHLVPAAPGLFDLLAQIPLMDTRRAREELGWLPEYDALEAIREALAGVEEGKGADTPPLAPETSGRFRSHEMATGVGEQD